MFRDVKVSSFVRVHVDESKFTPEFMEEFRQHFYPFTTIDEHLEHLAQLYVRGIATEFPGCFIEGYGPREGMGIHFEPLTQREEVLSSSVDWLHHKDAL